MTDTDIDQLIAKLAADVAARTEQCRMLDDAVIIPKDLYHEWIAANDEALNWADASARAFPIETAPKERWIEFWDKSARSWRAMWLSPQIEIDADFYTHWREPFPPPSNPPLPAPIERLGEVLRRIKGVS